MLLAIDIGNTSITFAVYIGEALQANWSIATDTRRTGDEYAALIASLMVTRGLSLDDIDGVVVSSVVPTAIDALTSFSEKHLGISCPLVLTNEVDLGITIHYEPKSDVGADRLANAVAAHAKHSGKVIIVDFGTATTLDAVSETGDYLGGAIAPGIQISVDALISRAAKLTGVELTAPDRAIGQSTAGSLRSGILYGYAGQVDALVDLFQHEMGGGAKVVATGGLASLVVPYSRTIECCDELLTLDGLRIIYERCKH